MADPKYDKDEIRISRTELGHLAQDVTYDPSKGQLLIADFGVDWRHLKQTIRADRLLADWLKKFKNDESYRPEILGYTDTIGEGRNNDRLRKGRAANVLALFDPKTRKRVKSGPAPVGTFVADNKSIEGRARNRSVVIIIKQEITLPDEHVSSRTCADVAKSGDTMVDYVMRLRCIEALFPQNGPRLMLSLLRQRYYGEEKWSCDGGPWKKIIPCGAKLPDPMNASTRPLLESLCGKKGVGPLIKDGGDTIDVGHVLAGLEAMVCPTKSIPFTFKGIDVPLDVSNEEVATWVGDLASAVAKKVADRQLHGVTKDWDAYFLGANTVASEPDLIGDIDCFSIRAGLLGLDCEASRMVPLKPFTWKVSDVFLDYYFSKGLLAGKKDHRFSCFLRAIGGEIYPGNRLNKSGFLAQDIAPRIHRTAKALYARFHDKWKTQSTAIRAASDDIALLFVRWLEEGLSREP